MKKYLVIAFLLISSMAFGQLNLVNVGTSANDNTGDPLRTAFQKVNLAITQVNTNTTGLTLKATYPGAGIPLSTGAAWAASITNNSANWNTAYGWGDHSAAGYFVGTSVTIRGLFSSTATGLTYTSGTGVFSFTAGYSIPLTTSQNNWNTAYGWGDHAGLYDPVGTGAGAVGTHESTYNHTNYNTAYTDRLKWDGGATGLVAATGRISLGGTTVGQSVFTLANPGAITFLRINADNSVTARSVANIKSDLGATSVGDAFFTLTDPGAITFPRINADNTVTTLSSANFKIALTLTSADVSLGNLTNKLQVEVEDSTGSAALTYLTGYQGSLKVPYSDAAAGDVDIAGELVAASTNTGAVTATTATITDVTVSGTLVAELDGGAITWPPGATLDGKHYEMIFEVDTTANAPAAGDSIYTDARFADMHVVVSITDTVTGQLFELNENYWEADKYSYEFTDATGVFTFHPKFATAQVVKIIGTNSALWDILTPPAAAYHAFYQDVYDGYTSKPSEAVVNACNAWITALDTIDYWSGGTSVLDRCDLILVPAIDVNSTNEALMWWTDPTQYATNVSGTEWTALQGYTGDGIANYIAPNYNPIVDGIHVSQDNMTVIIYLRIDQQEDKTVFGNYSSSGANLTLRPRTTADMHSARINQASGIDISGSSEGSDGLFILTRTASDAVELYYNGVSDDAETDVSNGLVDDEIIILGREGLSDFSTNQFSLFIILDKIYHDDEAAAINTVTEIFADAIGFGVQP